MVCLVRELRSKLLCILRKYGRRGGFMEHASQANRHRERDVRDFLLAGCVYVPAYMIGKEASLWIDPFMAGWLVAATAVCIRWQLTVARS
jgi:hypothetical protein